MLTVSDWIAVAGLVVTLVSGVSAAFWWVAKVVAHRHVEPHMAKVSESIAMLTVGVDHLRLGIERLDSTIADERVERREDVARLSAELRAVPTNRGNGHVA